MKRFVIKQPSLFGGDSLADYCLSNIFYDPNGIHRQKNHWITESDDTITLSIDVPGIKKSDLSIDYKDQRLSITAETVSDAGQERHLERYFDIDNIDIKKSSAELEDGVLTIHLEKTGRAKAQKLAIS